MNVEEFEARIVAKFDVVDASARTDPATSPVVNATSTDTERNDAAVVTDAIDGAEPTVTNELVVPVVVPSRFVAIARA